LPDVSIVIPTLNGGALFRRVLEMIKRQATSRSVEILCIDSGSTDDTAAMCKEFGAEVTEIPRAEFNHGETRNLGIGRAAAEFVILMTQDALPTDEKWLDALLEPFSDEKVAGTYARQVPRDDADILTRHRLENWITFGRERIVREIRSRAEYEALPPVEKYKFCNFDNVCSCIRRSVWEKFRFKRADFAEDMEWSRDALLAGWKIVYQPEAAVIHSHNRSQVYEHRRTYMVVRRLNELFGYRPVENRKEAFWNGYFQALQDARVVEKAKAPILTRWRTYLGIPWRNLLVQWAQWRAVRDIDRGAPIEKQRGV
jgi:rhamnosyltransferase